MIPLVMVMRHVFIERMPQRGFPKQDQPGEGFLFNGAHPPLREGVQWWWQWDVRDAGRVNTLLKGRAVFAIPVMDQVLSGREEASCLHCDVAGHLHHPGFIGMWRDPSHMDLPAAQMDEKESVVCHQPP